jgi:gamma-glutamylcyclotransferase
VEVHEGSHVWGVLYAISDRDLHTLDEGEGGYHRVRFSVRRTDNTNTDAWMYVASKPRNDPALRPYKWYKRFLVEGAREHFLPPLYIADLELIEAVQDSDSRRDGDKRALA